MYKNFNFDWFSTFSVRGYPTKNVKNSVKIEEFATFFTDHFTGNNTGNFDFLRFPPVLWSLFFCFFNEFSHVLGTLKFYKLSLYSKDFKFLRFFLSTAYWRFCFLRSFLEKKSSGSISKNTRKLRTYHANENCG